MCGTVCRRNLLPIGPSNDGGKPCGHAWARLMEEGQPALQHGLERWLVRRVWWHHPVPNRGTRETPDTRFLEQS